MHVTFPPSSSLTTVRLHNMKFINYLFALILALLFGSCSVFRSEMATPKKEGKIPKFSEEQILLGELTPVRTCFDVNYYDLQMDVHPENQTLNGTVFIHAIATADFDTLQIDLHPNFEITALEDGNSNQALSYDRKHRAVFVQSSHKKGDRFILKVVYNGAPEEAKKAPWKGGFVWKEDGEGKPWIGVACESDGASLWWPLKDHTADEPDSVRMTYTVPKGLVGVGNGVLENIVENEKSTSYTWFVSYPINTYNVTIYVGDFTLVQDTYKGLKGEDLTLNYYVLKPHAKKAEQHFKQTHHILKVYERMFGLYPWYKDGFKMIESPYAGMEHQSAIAYGNGYKDGGLFTTDYIILHETAHEWWGNSITVKDLADVWIQEGFATYSESVYYEQIFGENYYNLSLNRIRSSINNKYPIVGVEGRRWFHFRKHSDVYVKGSWILHTLRQQLDDDTLFFDIISSFYDQYKYSLVESQDFINVVNEKTGKDYTWFFEVYLHQHQSPNLNYEISKTGELTYRWTNVPESFNQLKIKLRANGEKIILTPSSNLQTYQIDDYDPSGVYRFEKRSLYSVD